ncbi:MAG TPA: hypothetical protein VK326_02360 [Solirubrobacterales bacterium]|nr:hypothetical protein [Solirubrobacterales bacterium]
MRSRSHQLRRWLALTTVIGAVAAPAGSAAVADPPIPGADVPQDQRSDNGYVGSVTAIARPETPRSPVVSTSSDSAGGFDWGDAGIGAAGMLALGAVGAGAALTFGHRRARHRLA